MYKSVCGFLQKKKKNKKKKDKKRKKNGVAKESRRDMKVLSIVGSRFNGFLRLNFAMGAR